MCCNRMACGRGNVLQLLRRSVLGLNHILPAILTACLASGQPRGYSWKPSGLIRVRIARSGIRCGLLLRGCICLISFPSQRLELVGMTGIVGDPDRWVRRYLPLESISLIDTQIQLDYGLVGVTIGSEPF